MNINELKVGDNAIVEYCGGANQRRTESVTVTKITKTQITVSNGMRFLKDGTKFGEANKTRGWFTFLKNVNA